MNSKLKFKYYTIHKSLFDLVSDYYNELYCPWGAIEDLTKEQMNVLIEETFDFYKKDFNCYETIRAKIKNYLSPITNSIALIEHVLKIKSQLSTKELRCMKNDLELSVHKLLSL